MADSPIQAEAAQALFCAMADYVGVQNVEKHLNSKLYPSYTLFKRGGEKSLSNKKLIELSYAQLEVPGVSLKDMEDFLIKKPDWYESSILIAVKIIQELTSIDKDFKRLDKPKWSNIMYVRGAKADKSRSANAMENIEALFKIANKNDKNVFGDVNKWSPADIYFVSDKADKAIDEEVGMLSVKAGKGSGSIQDSYNFLNLNELCNDLLDSGDLLPLSLKKAKGTATLYNYNFVRSKEEKELAAIKYFGVSNWKTLYTPKKPITRDIKIYFSKNLKERIKVRHDPTTSGNFGVNKAIKFEIEVSGAGGRGGSVVAWPIITRIISEVDKKLSSDLSAGRTRGLVAYEKALDKLNKIYGVKQSDNKRVLKQAKNGEKIYDAYKADRVDLSGVHICNNLMPILYKWFTANQDDKKKRKLNDKFLQKFVEYTSSRSPKSGKFVIAK